MTGTGHHDVARRRPDGTCHTTTQVAVLLVPLAGHDDHGHGQAVELVPPRSLRARPRVPEARREPGRMVGTPLGGTGRVRVEPGEERLGQPAVEEHVEGEAGSAARGRVELVSQALVSLPAGGPLTVVVDTGRSRDQDQGGDQLGVGEGDVEAVAGAHGVADVGAPAARLGHELRACDEVGVDGVRLAVPRQVEGDDLVIGSQVVCERPPHVPGLGEPVRQDDHRPLASSGGRECGPGVVRRPRVERLMAIDRRRSHGLGAYR